MTISDQIRKALRDCGEPLTMAQLTDANGWDAEDRNQASKNLYNMRKAGEVVTHVAEEKVHYALVADYVRGKRGAGKKASTGKTAQVASPKVANELPPAKEKATKSKALAKINGKSLPTTPVPIGSHGNACSFAQLAALFEEVSRATRKFPKWPNDPLHAIAVLGEEFGELTKAVLQRVYEPEKSSAADIRMEALQTAAMSLRFLMSLDAYEYARGRQHLQVAS